MLTALRNVTDMYNCPCPVDMEKSLRRPRFSRKSVAGGILKMPTGAKNLQNRARWSPKCCPPGALFIFHVKLPDYTNSS